MTRPSILVWLSRTPKERLFLKLGIGAFLIALASLIFLLMQRDDIPTLSGLPFSEELASTTPVIAEPVFDDYLEVTEGCGIHHEGTCVVVRSGPGEGYPVVARLRKGVVFRVSETVSADGHTWHKVLFDDWIRYPERVSGSWYVAATDFVNVSEYKREQDLPSGTTASSSKRILVDRSSQTLKAYDGEVLFMEATVSTGLDLTPTPRGTFNVYKKTPSRYMQGPLPGISDQYYDLPGVPWNLYFTYQGGVIHGAYWHESFGQPWSHGCVNLRPSEAKKLYEWADVGTRVIVRD